MLCAIQHVAAATYSISATTINNDILPNESASYEITISNFEQIPGDFQAYTADPKWSVKTIPLSLIVDPKSPKTFTLFLRPSNSASYGTQGVPITFKDLTTGTIIEKVLVLNLRDPLGPRHSEYAATVTIDVLMPYDIDPRTPIPLRLQLRNRNPLNITNLVVTISSPHFKTDTKLNLAPLSEKTKDIPGISIDPLTPPGEAEVLVQVLYKDEIITQVTKNYRIKEYTQIQQRINEEESFFKTTKTITITNEGNIKNNAIVSVPTSFIKNLFISSSSPHETEVIDGIRKVIWTIPLDPNATRTFTYTENYRILVLLAILSIIGGIMYFILRSPIVVIKEAVALAHDGAVSDIKVRVFIRNRSSKIIQAIQVTDKVPILADVIRTESPGSTAPSKIAHNEKHGTLLRWDFEVLEPYEERVVTYQMKSKLKIIGKMKLPNARVRFTVRNRERTVYSNNIELIERFKDK